MKKILCLLVISAFITCSCSSIGDAENTDNKTKTDSVTLNIAAAADSMERLGLYGRKFDGLTKDITTAEEAMQFMQQSPNKDKYLSGVIPVIARQNAQYASKLLRNKFPYFILVNKQTMTLTLYDRYGHTVRYFPVACSRHYGTKHKFRDNRTPEGFFAAEGVYDSTDWLYTNDDGYTSPAKGVYGPRFTRVDCPVTRSVGIHGTNSPWSPGHRVSHGCMRLLNSNAVWLVKHVQKGTPIIINPSAQDDRVNREEGYKVPMLSFNGQPIAELPVRPEKVAEAKANAEKDKKEAKTEKAPEMGPNGIIEPAEKPEPTEEPKAAPAAEE